VCVLKDKLAKAGSSTPKGRGHACVGVWGGGAGAGAEGGELLTVRGSLLEQGNATRTEPMF
jgi:hypothetical protein